MVQKLPKKVVGGKSVELTQGGLVFNRATLSSFAVQKLNKTYKISTASQAVKLVCFLPSETVAICELNNSVLDDMMNYHFVSFIVFKSFNGQYLLYL